MPVVRAFDRANVLDIGKSCLEVADPIPETIRESSTEGIDDPWQIRAIGSEAVEPQWRTRLPHQ